TVRTQPAPTLHLSLRSVRISRASTPSPHTPAAMLGAPCRSTCNERRMPMIRPIDPAAVAALEQRVEQLANRLRRDRAIVIGAARVLCALAMGQKRSTPGKIVAQEIVMVDEAGREWAVLGLDGNRRRGIHLFGGGIGDVKSSPDRSKPLLSLIGPYVCLADYR